MECIKAIKSTTELKPLFIKGNNSVFTCCFGFSFVAGFNGDENIVWNQAHERFGTLIPEPKLGASSNRESMLGNRYSEIPDINTVGNMVWNQVDSGNIVWHQVQRGIPEAGVLSQYSRMSDVIGYKGSLIQASRRTSMPTWCWTLESARYGTKIFEASQPFQP